jgi:hypothetical protein
MIQSPAVSFGRNHDRGIASAQGSAYEPAEAIEENGIVPIKLDGVGFRR